MRRSFPTHAIGCDLNNLSKKKIFLASDKEQLDEDAR
jgi:hypothetical protein